LNGAGRIVWFTDRGFSAGQMMDLDAAARELLLGPAAQSATRPAAP
jgi:hypothetical protein